MAPTNERDDQSAAKVGRSTKRLEVIGSFGIFFFHEIMAMIFTTNYEHRGRADDVDDLEWLTSVSDRRRGCSRWTGTISRLEGLAIRRDSLGFSGFLRDSPRFSEILWYYPPTLLRILQVVKDSLRFSWIRNRCDSLKFSGMLRDSPRFFLVFLGFS